MNRFEARDLLSRLTRKGVEGMLGAAEALSGAHLSYRARPRRAADVGNVSTRCPDLPPLAVVLQGPVLAKSGFTLETAKLYQRTFPDAALVLSTWKNEPAATLRAFKALGVDVVASDPPAHPGQQNINYQLVSASAGMARAAALGAQYVLKTRTDQRLYAPNLQPMLMNLLDVFPLKTEGAQRRRIVGTSLMTPKFRMYGLSDMTLFGHIDDMRLYWGAALNVKVVRPTGPQTLREWAQSRICEVYLATEFLTALGRKQEWTLADSWRAFAEHFCVTDHHSLDIYWPKYAHYRERRYGAYAALRADELMGFTDWLQYYSGAALARAVPEELLEVRGEVLGGGS